VKQVLDIEDKRIWVQGLLIDCPVGAPLDTCPAKDLRQMPLKDRLKLVVSMTEEQLDEIIAHHRACLAERER
jgi:hypothetical protein